MNLINGTLIDLLISAAETLRNEICKVLEQYKSERDREKSISERYKDESGYFSEQQSKLAAYAREMIAKAERTFSAKVDDYTKQMEEQLKKHLSMPVNNQFREKLSMLSEFGIQPEKIEIEDLISLNGGNQIGLTALAKTLEKVDSPFVLKYHTTADYQKDIAEIRDLTRNLKYIPIQYHHEGCEIYRGITADYANQGGGIIGGRINYDSVSLLMNATAFESEIEKIKGMKDVWSADCSYDEADRGAEADRGTEIESADPVSETRIEENPNSSEGMRVAKQLGKDAAKARQVYNELVNSGYAH